MVERLAPLFNSRYFFRLVAITYMAAAMVVALSVQLDGLLDSAPTPTAVEWGRMTMIEAAAFFALGWLLFPFGSAMDRNFRGRASGWIAVGHFVAFCGLLMLPSASALSDRQFVSFVEWMFLGVTGAFVWFWIFPDHDFRNPVGSLPWSGGAHKSYRYERHVLEEASKLERQRLGMEFHDTVLQSLHVITTDAATAYARFDEDPEGSLDALARVREGAQTAVTAMRAILDSPQAEPIEETGLIEQIRSQCEALGFRTGAAVTFDCAKAGPNQHDQLMDELEKPMASQYLVDRVDRWAISGEVFSFDPLRHLRHFDPWGIIYDFVIVLFVPINWFLIECSAAAQNRHSRTLHPHACVSLLRVVQEGLSNIARHARATNVTVKLTVAKPDKSLVRSWLLAKYGQDENASWEITDERVKGMAEHLCLEISDNGSGFNPDKASVGMGRANMRKRVQDCDGLFHLSSRPRSDTAWPEYWCLGMDPLWGQESLGTTISVAIPYRTVTLAPNPFLLGPWNGIHSAILLAMAAALTVEDSNLQLGWVPLTVALSLPALAGGLVLAHQFILWLITRKRIPPDMYSGLRTVGYGLYGSAMILLSFRYPWLHVKPVVRIVWAGLGCFVGLSAIRNLLFYLHYRKTGYFQYRMANRRCEYQ